MNTDHDIFFGLSFALIGALLIVCGAVLGKLDAPLLWSASVFGLGVCALVFGALVLDGVRE